MSKAEHLEVEEYDIILAGGGCAGLLMAHELITQDYKGTVLIIDQDDKNLNDRTWSFWEVGENPLDNIVYKTWDYAWFYGHKFEKRLSIAPYQYKMIRGIDLYTYIKDLIKKAPNFKWEKARIEKFHEQTRKSSIRAEKELGMVETSHKQFVAPIIFNSIHSYKDFTIPESYHTLLQHFKGWTIKTKKPVFEEEAMTYMDYRVSHTDEAIFSYVLPFSKDHALIEYTLFNQTLLADKVYDEALIKYLKQYFNLNPEDYNIEEVEFGIIPMSNYPFPSKIGNRIYNLGSAGGNTKATTGYTFLRLQKEIPRIVQNILNEEPIYKGLNKGWNRFKLYDSILLNVLRNKTYSGPKFFEELFEKKGPQKVFKFLDEETNIWEELNIMNISPKGAFTKAFIQEFSRLF